MIALSNTSLEYAVAACTERPHYKVIIGYANEEARYMIAAQISSIIQRDYYDVVDKSVYGKIRSSIAFTNGSVITLLPENAPSKGTRCNLLICDMPLLDAAKAILQRTEIGDEGYYLIHGDIPCELTGQIHKQE